ncbi:DUF4338 domain-containing protein [Alphaproteobacteria bacterium]|nr:DUF4338 domain-containing protein [Alphaproteobacteria bacterium]
MKDDNKRFVSFTETNEGGVPIWPQFSKEINKVLFQDKSLILKTEELRNKTNDFKKNFGNRGSAYLNILTDLLQQGIEIENGNEGFWITKPESSREITKAQLLVRRDDTLQKEPVSKFISKCENDKNKKSIEMLFHDGHSLADDIKKTLNKGEDLNTILDPQIQFVEDKVVDELTGISLQEIWRYCRLTWTLENQPVPGRQIPFIIRNHAYQNKYIMGIGCLVSPILQHEVRDKWIGWTTKVYGEKIAKGSLSISDFISTLDECINVGIKNINIQGLGLTVEEIDEPNSISIIKLERKLNEAKNDRINELKDDEKKYRSKIILDDLDDQKVLELSNTKALWISKRATLLIKFLRAKLYLQNVKNLNSNQKKISSLFINTEGKETVNFLINVLRIDGVASKIVDLNVCGAIPPYNHIITGKLVALACASSELQEFYSQKYEKIPGEISSYIAGRKIYRSTKLEIMTTTSIYGKYPSQYNRLKLSSNDYPEIKFDLNLEQLNLTRGKGTLHFSSETSKIFKDFFKSEKGFSQVNGVFGEGTSPKLRNIATVLSMLNLPAEWIMTHNQKRMFLGMEINKDAKKNLCNIFSNNDKTNKPRFVDIARCWLDRWVVNRLNRSDVLEKIKQENFGKLSKSIKPKKFNI